MHTSKLSIHGRLAELADATRCRLLLALEGQELTVSELCQGLVLPQSTVSRHLRILSDQQWATSRADGASRWYRMSPTLDEEAISLWELVRKSLLSNLSTAQDAARIHAVVQARRSRSEAFFADAASDWDAMRMSMFGTHAHLGAALALLDPTLVVGDLGCGTGALAQAIAPFVAHVHAIDASHDMLNAARARLAGTKNVTVREGKLESLPFADASFDSAIMLLVLHHVAQPAKAIAEARRVVKPGGRLLIADMRSHTREEYRQQMGHVWLGFEESSLQQWTRDAGFAQHRYLSLPVDAAATGPSLFAMVVS